MPILQERGHFWYAEEPIPEGRIRPFDSVAGELKIEDDGKICLNLDAPFPVKAAPGTITITAGKKTYEMLESGIHGTLNNHHHVYLHGLMGDGVFRTQLHIRDCFIGRKPFPHTDTIPSFKKFDIDMKGFEGWFCFPSLEHTDSDEELSITYKKTKDAIYDVGNAIITIHCGANWSISQDASLEQRASLTYEAKEPLTLKVMTDKYRLIEDLFILLTNSEYRMDFPTVFLTHKNAKYIYYFSRHKGSTSTLDWYECWTNFIMIRANFGQLFSALEAKQRIFGSGFYLYLATRRGVQTYLENRFMDLMMGFESFHRRKYPEISDQEAIARRQKIIEKIEDESEKKWLVGKLQYAHEPPAAHRLKDTLRSIIPKKLDKGIIARFAHQCIKIRNDMVHGNRRGSEEGSLDFLVDLDKRSDALSYLYHLLILSEIGIDEATLITLVERKFEIKQGLIAVGLLDSKTMESA